MRIIDLIPVLSKRVVKYQLGQQFFPGFGKVNTGMRVQKFGRITFVFFPNKLGIDDFDALTFRPLSSHS